MIMILSFCDFLAVLINNPLIILFASLYLTESFGTGSIRLEHIRLASRCGNFFFGFSLQALFVMSCDRYLATHHPIFHRTSVTRRKLTSLLVLVIVIKVVISTSAFVRTEIALIISYVIYAPPMFFFNFKLFVISRKKANSQIACDRKKAFALKNVSSCLLLVICLVVMSIPTFAFVGVAMNSAESTTFDVIDLVGLWAKTIISMNSTSNCLIFYWKDKFLRTVGVNIIKGMKIRRLQS